MYQGCWCTFVWGQIHCNWYDACSTLDKHFERGWRLVDNTNADKEVRSKWIELAAQHKIPIRCVLFLADPALCQHNNAVRALNHTVSLQRLNNFWLCYFTMWLIFHQFARWIPKNVPSFLVRHSLAMSPGINDQNYLKAFKILRKWSFKYVILLPFPFTSHFVMLSTSWSFEARKPNVHFGLNIGHEDHPIRIRIIDAMQYYGLHGIRPWRPCYSHLVLLAECSRQSTLRQWNFPV